jgi:SEL1 protein
VGEERAGHGEEDKEIIEYYDYTASKGDTRAQLAMGQLNYWGARGLEQDFEAASVWFGKAAEGGESHAMSMLGHMYANGLAVEQSNETALEWFNKVSAHRHIVSTRPCSEHCERALRFTACGRPSRAGT